MLRFHNRESTLVRLGAEANLGRLPDRFVTFQPNGPEGSEHGFVTKHGVFHIPLIMIYRHFSAVHLETAERATVESPNPKPTPLDRFTPRYSGFTRKIVDRVHVKNRTEPVPSS